MHHLNDSTTSQSHLQRILNIAALLAIVAINKTEINYNERLKSTHQDSQRILPPTRAHTHEHTDGRTTR